VKIAVFFVLAIHGIGLLALLMQGCRRDESGGAGAGGPAAATNAAAAATFEATNVIAEPSPAPSTQTVTTTTVPPAGPGSATDYKVVKGDTLGTIATHHKVTLKALVDANPGVDPVKLQIGQPIHIPAPAPAPAPTGNNGGTPAVDLATGEKIYSVKTGYSLTTIAKSQGTTIVKLRAANGLKTDAIRVGQKLKIPAGSTPPPAGTNATTPTTP